jgi:outer membrane protein
MKLFCVTIIFLLSFSLPAQVSTTSRKLTWDECVRLAQQNNLELHVALSNLTAAEYNTIIAQSNFYPHISASASGSQTSLNDNVTNSYSAQLGFTQNIFAGFTDFYKTKQSDIDLKIAQTNLQIAQAQLSSDLKQAFETLLYVQSTLVLTQDIVRSRQDNLQNVQLRFNGGRENKGAVLLSQAYSSQARFEELQVRNQFASAQENLGRILGIAQYAEIQVQDNRVAQASVIKVTESQFADLAMKAPDYQIIQLQEKSADMSWNSARAGFYPSLDLSGSYGKIDSVFFPELNDRWNVGLTLSIPLFDGGRDYAAIKSAAAMYRVANQNAASSFLQTKNRIRNAYDAYVQAVEKAKVDTIFKNAAEVRADIARSKYNNGLMTFDDWDIVESDLISRQKASLNSNRDVVFREADWEKIQGIGVIQ